MHQSTIALFHVTVEQDAAYDDRTVITEVFKAEVSPSTPITSGSNPDTDNRIVLTRSQPNGGFLFCEDLGDPCSLAESVENSVNAVINEAQSRIPDHFPDRDVKEIDVIKREPLQ